MNEMGQVSRTVALFLVILPHFLRSEDETPDGRQIERNIKNSMHRMANNLEMGLPISLAETKSISKAFFALSEYVRKKTEIIKPGRGNSSTKIYFKFSKKKKLRRGRV